MKIGYIAHTRFPTEKAHGHQMARVCEALNALGHSVTLVAPGVHNEVKDDAMTYYSVKQQFSLEYVSTKDALLSPYIPGRFAMLFTMRSYRLGLTSFLKSHQFDLLYARSPHVLVPMLATNMPVVLELHTLPRRGRSTFVKQCTQCALVVCLTTQMKHELMEWGVPAAHIVVESDAVDLRRFEHVTKRDFNLQTGKPVVGYIGSLSTMDHVSKGVDLLIQAAADKQSFFTLIVGGPANMVAQYKTLATSLGLTDDDIRFTGPVASQQVPEAIAACDVCVYPAPKSSHPYFLRDTSPLKLFEYLAAGKQIVCADIPPVHDIITEEVVHLVPPGDPHALAEAISDAIEHPLDPAKGLAIAKEHTWEKRMERILSAVR